MASFVECNDDALFINMDNVNMITREKGQTLIYFIGNDKPMKIDYLPGDLLCGNYKHAFVRPKAA